jgi:hypothetical protein
MILKKNKVSGFTQIDNVPIQGGNLSYKAIGILTYLLSHNDEWETAIENLVNHSPKDGITAVRSGLDELVEHDYAALVVVRDADNGQMMGTRYVVSDDSEWIKQVKTAKVLSVSARKEERYSLRFDEDRDAGFLDVGKTPTSGKSDPKKERPLKKKESKSHSLTSDDGEVDGHLWMIDDWQYKASQWWLSFLKTDGRLPPTLLRRKNEERLIQEWASVLDKLNRIDGHAPNTISQVLAWLKKTKDIEGQGKFWLEDAKLTSLASVRKPSRSNPDYTKFDMILTSSLKYTDAPENKTRRPERG